MGWIDFDQGDYRYRISDDTSSTTAKVRVIDTTKSSYGNIPSSVDYNGRSYSVKDATSCFAYCSNMTTAPSIPDSVNILKECFYECYSLYYPPTIPAHATDLTSCFESCFSMRLDDESYSGGSTLSIPSTVTKMSNCFKDCTYLGSGRGKNINVANNPSEYSNMFGGADAGGYGIFIVPDNLNQGGVAKWRSIASEKDSVHYYGDDAILSTRLTLCNRVAASDSTTASEDAPHALVRVETAKGGYIPNGYSQSITYAMKVNGTTAQPENQGGWENVSSGGTHLTTQETAPALQQGESTTERKQAWFAAQVTTTTSFELTATDYFGHSSTITFSLAKVGALLEAYHGSDGEGLTIGTIAEKAGLNVAMESEFSEKLHVITPEITRDTVPSSNVWPDHGVFIDDEDGENVGYLRAFSRMDPSDYEGMQFETFRTVNDTVINHGLQLGIDSSGNRWVRVHDAKPWRDALGAFWNAETKVLNTDFYTWVTTAANIHHSYYEEAVFARFYINDGSTPSTYNLPCYDQHVTIHSIDNSLNYIRCLAFDIRTNNVYVNCRNNGTWTGWQAMSLNGHTHSYLPLSGGTETGSITSTNASPLFLKAPNINRDAGNPSSAQYENQIWFKDKDNENIGLLRSWRNTSGTIGLQLGVCNENSSNNGDSWLWLSLQKPKAGGAGTWSVGEPANFRSAIGLGEASTSVTTWSSNTNSKSIEFYRRGKVVMCMCESITVRSSGQIATIPSGWRPSRFMGARSQKNVAWNVWGAGEITVEGTTSSDNLFIMYVID